MDSQKLVADLGHKWELVSYLSRLSSDKSGPFKKDLGPPNSIAKEFLAEFKKWVDNYIISVSGDGQSPQYSEFTQEEVKALKLMASNVMARSSGMPSRTLQPTPQKHLAVNTQDASAPARKSKSAHGEATQAYKPGAELFVIDSSVMNDPNIHAGSKVILLQSDGVNAMVRLKDNPLVAFSTTLNNLTLKDMGYDA